MARPKGTPRPRKFTEDEIKAINHMAMVGMTQEQIAGYLCVNRDTFRKYLQENSELKHAFSKGKNSGIRNVSIRAYSMAMSGKNPQMTAFYLKAKAGWTEVQKVEHSGRQEIVFKTQIGEDGTIRTTDTEKDQLNPEDVGYGDNT